MYLSNNVWTFFVIVVLSNVIDVQDTLSLKYHVDSCDAWIFQTSNASASFKSERLRGIELKSVNEYLNSIKMFQNHLGRLFLKTSCQSSFNKYEFSSNVTLVKRSHSSNALSPMVVTLLGMVIFVKSSQRWKAPLSIVVNWLFSSKITVVKFLQVEKAYSPMVVTLLGMVMLVNLLKSTKTRSPMAVTGFPLCVLGIIMSPLICPCASTTT